MNQTGTEAVADFLAAGKDEQAIDHLWENYFIPDSAVGQYTFTPVK